MKEEDIGLLIVFIGLLLLGLLAKHVVDVNHRKKK